MPVSHVKYWTRGEAETKTIYRKGCTTLHWNLTKDLPMIEKAYKYYKNMIYLRKANSSM